MGNAALSAFHGDVELGLGNGDANAVAGMVEAGQDVARLRRALFAGGVGKAAAVLYLALFRSPAGLFLRNNPLFYSYYIVLVIVVIFGVAEAWVGLWASHDRRRRAVGMTMLWLSVLPLLFLAGIGGSAILKLK
ncbi:hypothetical protein OsI_17197 [Oryza sativa Indica Group]|uniref:Uncharacterized protein n=3 Tax=Oryza TaxID=4527 RepID=A0A0E0PDE2_ORYRU|nr:hypothetical protein OsI_17197 [Oryza sativa Indica Group]KAF2935600.1 hypothetical protein DAI22_04g243800 [Oryza sativa Japonica Group]